jgi:Cu+-exporting ATPase
MQVEVAHAPASAVGAGPAGETVYFCSDRCRDRYVGGGSGSGAGSGAVPAAATSVDPICGMTVDPATAPAHRVRDGAEYHFCNPGCAAAFDAQATSTHEAT